MFTTAKVICPSFFYLESFLFWRATASVWISRSCWFFRGSWQRAKPSYGPLSVLVTAVAGAGRHGVTTKPGDVGLLPGSATYTVCTVGQVLVPRFPIL